MNIFTMAVEMEMDLEKHYLKQAKINKDNELNQIFTMLASDERKHADILRSKSEKLDYELKDSKTLEDAKNLFKEMGDFKLEDKELPDQLDSLRYALEMEKKSIDAYTKMLSETEDKNVKEMLSFLISQEENHFEIIEELIFHLNKPVDWVEDAEFTQRHDY